MILLRRIRDEAHRFAITFQKEKRSKDLTRSIYEDIRGMGKKRLNILFRFFNGPKEISKLTPEVIKNKTGIPIEIAKEVINISKIKTP